MSPQEYDEIDLLELVRSLWDGKWLIGGISAAALAVGGAYVALTPNKFDASIIVRPIDASALEHFRPVNDAFLDKTDAVALTTPYVSSHSLLAEFIEVLLQRQTIAQAARDNEAMGDRYTGGTSLEPAFRAFAFGVDIKPIEIPAPSPSGTSNTTTGWRLTWEAGDQDISEAFISDALRLTNDTARERLIRRISVEAEQIQRSNARRASQLEREIEHALQDYQIQVSDSLTYLSEQASLARVLGIEYGTGTRTGTTNLNTDAQSSAVNASSGMTYLVGYRALEEQISLISSRERFEAFVPGLRDMQSELRSVEQDTSAVELLAAVEVTPLSRASEFSAAQYDLASINVIYHKKTNLILALSLVLGGFVGAVTVLMRNEVNARRGRQ